ncbi:MAG: type II toxin-antitoxin system HicA family toxin [Armatimonadota bacterium]|nr:type II toxin-antitoxin system HicA family toxin [Armatimonadota bacterium]MDR7537754.1 type II toxin-antitoxin system HicA family toxin [Armatimonadota bacterium]
MVALERAGFSCKRQTGSHVILRRDELFAQVFVPDHAELDRGLRPSCGNRR